MGNSGNSHYRGRFQFASGIQKVGVAGRKPGAA